MKTKTRLFLAVAVAFALILGGGFVSYVSAGTKQVIDAAGDVGINNSIATDSNNKIHISYCDVTNGTLKYATNASGLWTTYTIDSATTSAGAVTSIAIDSNNKVHISYMAGGSTSLLKYATNASGAWVTSIISNNKFPSGLVGFFSSIAIDANNKVHISFSDGGSLLYATNALGSSSGSWDISGASTGGGWSSIAIDSNNKVHISHYDGENVLYTTNKTTTGYWKTKVIEHTYFVNQESTSIAIDSNDKIHIAYRSGGGTGSIKYLTNKKGFWWTKTIDSAVGLANSVAIAIDSNDKVLINYISVDAFGAARLKYATDKAGFWWKSTIAAVGPLDLFTADSQRLAALAIDDNNNFQMSYYDISNKNLKYATNAP